MIYFEMFDLMCSTHIYTHSKHAALDLMNSFLSKHSHRFSIQNPDDDTSVQCRELTSGICSSRNSMRNTVHNSQCTIVCLRDWYVYLILCEEVGIFQGYEPHIMTFKRYTTQLLDRLIWMNKDNPFDS